MLYVFRTTVNSRRFREECERQLLRLDKSRCCFSLLSLKESFKLNINVFFSVLFRVVYGRLIGLEDILAQCSVEDSARLLNELHQRIDQIAKVQWSYNFAPFSRPFLLPLFLLSSLHSFRFSLLLFRLPKHEGEEDEGCEVPVTLMQTFISSSKRLCTDQT